MNSDEINIAESLSENIPSISQYFNNTPTSTFFDDINTTEQSTNIFGNIPTTTADFFEKVGPQTLLSVDSTNITQSNNSATSQDMNIYPNLSNNTDCGVGSNADRRREAWPFKPKTNDYDIQLTMPGVTVQDDLADPVMEMVVQLLGEEESIQRRLLSHADVTQDERGIRELIQAGCYRSAVNLTGRLLTIYGQGYGRAGQPAKHSPHSLQLWFSRLALLTKLRCHSICQLEAQPFGMLDKPDVFYQHYPEMYGGRIGSMACFAFRLLLAELPAHWDEPKEALQRLHLILATVRKVLRNLNNNLDEYGSTITLTTTDRQESIKLWAGREARTMHSIINSALQLKDFSLATQTLEILTKSPHWGAPHRRALHSAWGRILLQLGDVIAAEKQFETARGLKTDPDGVQDVRDLVDKGLIAVAQNAFQDGFLIFQKALSLDQTNVMILNNMGACLLYSGKVQEAISLLEKAVSINPGKALNENLLLNLCTLYELESSHSKAKKLKLLQQINRHKADLTGPVMNCLKLQL